jgi:tetraacyldisaccharide 4'-kinase
MSLDLQKHWQRTTPLSFILAPVAWAYCAVVVLRRYAYRHHVFRQYRAPSPVIVVGNLTVGGAGKTPLVCWLVRFLSAYGYHPGVVSRGYGGRSQSWPQVVGPQSDPAEVGDEPVLIAATAGVPVVVAPDRPAAVKDLLTRFDCNVVVSDDGLQHLALARDLEVVVIDGERRFGNNRCLPAGPLREPLSRLRSVDIRVCNGGDPLPDEVGMTLEGNELLRVDDPSVKCSAREFSGRKVHAVAGIGNPARFFRQLEALGMVVVPHPFPDHHQYRAEEIHFGGTEPVIMTQKDAVKCRTIADSRYWALPVTARFDPALGEQILTFLRNL